jgi:serine/threonine-protein kinase HipA
MADLVVELYGTRVGRLRGTGAALDFEAVPAAVETFGLDSLVLSVAIPLAVVPTRARKARRQNFFRELLPEGRLLTRLAQEAGVLEHDVVGMLRAYGRDVAGALQIWDSEAPGEPRDPTLEPVTESGVADLLRNAAVFPLANKPQGGKTSLNGVQDKIVLARTVDGWARALDGYPSTHILKPASRDASTIIYDEEYGARFARALGLATHGTSIAEFEGVPALVVERYDREPGTDGGRPQRIHQEDFNQVLGARGDQKYQRYGGKVSLASIARVLAVLGDHDGLRRLARLTVLSVAIGNLDMHAKNLALVHQRDGTVVLAPAYDVVPMAHLPTDGELALAVGREYRHAAVTRQDLAAEIAAWGVTDAPAIVDESLSTVRAVAEGEAPHPGAHPNLVEDVLRFTTNLQEGRPAGG